VRLSHFNNRARRAIIKARQSTLDSGRARSLKVQRSMIDARRLTLDAGHAKLEAQISISADKHSTCDS
jgi:hypothetical protein